MAIAEATYTATVEAGGTARVDLRTETRFQSWTVQQVSVEMSSAPVGATCVLRKGGALITPLIATGDAASGDPPVPLRPGELLRVEWAGCTPGDIGTVYVLYDDGRDPS